MAGLARPGAPPGRPLCPPRPAGCPGAGGLGPGGRGGPASHGQLAAWRCSASGPEAPPGNAWCRGGLCGGQPGVTAGLGGARSIPPGRPHGRARSAPGGAGTDRAVPSGGPAAAPPAAGKGQGMALPPPPPPRPFGVPSVSSPCRRHSPLARDQTLPGIAKSPGHPRRWSCGVPIPPPSIRSSIPPSIRPSVPAGLPQRGLSQRQRRAVAATSPAVTRARWPQPRRRQRFLPRRGPFPAGQTPPLPGPSGGCGAAGNGPARWMPPRRCPHLAGS